MHQNFGCQNISAENVCFWHTAEKKIADNGAENCACAVAVRAPTCAVTYVPCG